jgi:hypothetical protein
MIVGCTLEADYYMTKIVDEETANYLHLRIDTGEIVEKEVGGYSCSPDCEICNDCDAPMR